MAYGRRRRAGSRPDGGQQFGARGTPRGPQRMGQGQGPRGRPMPRQNPGGGQGFQPGSPGLAPRGPQQFGQQGGGGDTPGGPYNQFPAPGPEPAMHPYGPGRKAIGVNTPGGGGQQGGSRFAPRGPQQFGQGQAGGPLPRRTMGGAVGNQGGPRRTGNRLQRGRFPLGNSNSGKVGR